MFRRILFASAFLLPGALAAQASSATCDQVNHAIVLSEKAMSHIWAEGIVDNNVSREALREQQVANELQLVSANIQIAAQLKCTPRTEPISRNAYVAAAVVCVTAERRQAPVNTTPPAECDRELWRRDPKKQ